MTVAGILLLSVIWGSSFLFIKIGMNGGMSPTLVAGMRLSVGAALMWGIVVLRCAFAPQSFKRPIPKGGTIWRKLALVGLLNNAIPFTLIAWGEGRISSGLASIFNATLPLFVVVIAHYTTRDDRLTLSKAVGVVIGFIGTVITILPNAGDLSGEVAGALAVLLASLFYAIATIYVKKHLTGATDPMATGAGQVLCAFVWMLPVMLFGGALSNVSAIPPESFLAVTALGLLGTGLAYLIYYLLIQRAKVSTLSIVTYLVPITALVWGAIFLDEQITIYALVGLVLILVGIVLVNRSNTR